jgi:hypothetical protein
MLDKSIHEYIQKYRLIYTRDAIKNKLLEAGFSAEEIEQALDQAQVAAEAGALDDDVVIVDDAKPKISLAEDNFPDVDYLPPKRKSPQSVPPDFAVMFAYIIAVPLVAFIFASFGGSGSSLAFIWVVAMGFVGLMSSSVFSNPARAKGVNYGCRVLLVIFVVLPFVAAVAVAGVCLVAAAFS